MAQTSLVRRQQPSSGLGELLDKGLVIDAFVRVSLVGIELITVDARIVIASVDTYLRFVEAMARMDVLPEQHRPPGLPQVLHSLTEGGAEAKTRGALKGVRDAAADIFRSVRRRREHARERRPIEAEHEEEEEG